MIGLLLRFVVPGLWALFYLVWWLASMQVKETQRAEPALSRLLYLVVMVLAYAMNLTSWFQLGPLAWRFVPDTASWVWTGVLVQVLGLAFALLARAYLGRNWSGTVTIKVDHQLISRGPYAVTRHPIYSGLLLGLVGTAIAYGVVSGLVGCILMLGASLYKIRLEEQFLSVEFPSEYDQYRRRVKALIPRVW